MPGYAVVEPEIAALGPASLLSLPPAAIRAALGRAPAPGPVGPSGAADVAPPTPDAAPSSTGSATRGGAPADATAGDVVPADAALDPGAARPVIKLRRGDIVVFTGQMRVPREIWENRAVAAGLVPYPAVTPRVRLVVAGNPAALSGKARAALELGIPVLTEEEFGRLVAQRRRRP